jgi:hypothetical protein
MGMAVGRDHEAWARAVWQPRVLPEPEVVAVPPGELEVPRRDGAVDALLLGVGVEDGGRGVPAWALAAPRKWRPPAGWERSLAAGWRTRAGDALRWLYARLRAKASLG